VCFTSCRTPPASPCLPTQILASASWGSTLGNFFTGGLNLQIEHHLFPAISFAHYPAIQEVVREECAKRNIRCV
jgi:fatty acid desaturase (delta-4 desaturase)